MPAELNHTQTRWLCTGEEVFPAMLDAIESAVRSISLETYIFAPGSLGEKFLTALARAAARGLRVKVLIDALGSYGLPASFWTPLVEAGGQVRVFNPISLPRLGIRDHRKLLVCDDRIAIVGGFNVAPEYEGDGVTRGWCDLGISLSGPLVKELEASFQEMFARADFTRRFFRFPHASGRRTVGRPAEQLLLSAPGISRSPIKRALSKDFSRAADVRMIIAYFLPSLRMRRRLARIARRGGRVQLILAGKTDVLVSQLAARSLYRRLLRAGVEIYEYQPQVLHAKLIVIDNVVYVGSANLDHRSLNINYELMVRFDNPAMAGEAREVFAASLQHSQQITRESWRKGRSLWRRLKQHWAYFLLVRVDPLIARWQWRALPD